MARLLHGLCRRPLLLLKLELPRPSRYGNVTGPCRVDEAYDEFISEYHSARFLRSLRGPAELWENLPWHSDLFELAIDTASMDRELNRSQVIAAGHDNDELGELCPATAPAFLTKRAYGRVVYAPCDMSDLQYMVVGGDQFGLAPLEAHQFQNSNITILTSSILRLEAFVAEHALVFHDAQFIVTATGVELFDTMVAQCISIPCLATTYLRSFLLQTALGLTLQQTYFDHTGVGAVWKQGLLEAQQHTSKACSKLSVSAGASCDGAVLIGLPTAIPAEVLDDMEQDATGSSLLARLRVLSDQFAQQRIFMNASNAAGIVCLQELPVPSGAVRCGESPVMPVKHLFHLPKNFEVQLTGFFDGFRGSCVDWKFPSGLSCSGRIERERSLARQFSPVQTPPA